MPKMKLNFETLHKQQ